MCWGGESISPTITTRIAESQDGGINASMKVVCPNSDKELNVRKVYKNKAVNETIENNEIEDGDFLDCYNRDVKKDIAGTITTGVSSRNETFVAEKKYSKRSIECINENICEDICGTITAQCGNFTGNGVNLVKETETIRIKNATEQGYLEATEGDGIDISSRMESHRGTVQKDSCQTITTMGGNDVGVVVKLKRGYSCEVKPNDKESEGVVVIGNYSKSGFSQTPIVSEKGIAPTVTENHGQITTICEAKEDSLYTETEKQLFTKDGNIKRYLGSDKIDEFKEGQIATTTFPNGYGHGPRTHDECIALNTIDRPSVKVNLRIRKLTPKETGRLMGFEDKDYQAMVDCGLTDGDIWHCHGDSIVTTVQMAIFSNLFCGIDSHEEIINKYVDKLAERKLCN